MKQRLEMAQATKLFISILQLSSTYDEALLAEALQQSLTRQCFTLASVQEIARRLTEPVPAEPAPLFDYPQLAHIRVAQPNLQQFDQLLTYPEGGDR